MAPIDLRKNQNEILKLHKEVSDPKSTTNWALFGYEGKTDILEVVSKGDGGIEEFLQELNSGRIMYGYLKVIDPNSNLPKFVFVNWQGEGVPEIVKGSCTSHLREVSNLLKGAHISINARNEDDIDEETIKSKVSKSSGANYSFHKEQKKDHQEKPSGPVGSVYEKTKPQIELKPVLREKFWEDAAREEQNRKEAERKRLATEREKLDKEFKERELQDARKREEKENDRLKRAKEIKSANQQASALPKQDKTTWEKEQEQAKIDEEERSKRSDQLRKDRAREAQSLIASATSQARSVFMQKPVSQFERPKDPVPSRKLKTAFQEPEENILPQIAVCPPKVPVPSNKETKECLYDDGQAVQVSRRDSADEIYDDGTTYQGDTQGNVEQGYEDFYDDLSSHPESNTSTIAQGLPKRVESDEETYDSMGPEAIYDEAETSKAEGLCAVALYDYQAAEDNEITFDPGDRITDIDMIDEGWWIGTDNEGRRGMFPSNYVKLTN